MNRFPILPTLVVALAVGAMIALGVWQLQRRAEKAVALGQYAANLHLPPTAYPQNPADQSYLYRTLSAHCLRVTSWRSTGGRMPDGSPGWRKIAQCATGAEGPGFPVDMGTSRDPNMQPKWTGGQVAGVATLEPMAQSALLRSLEKGPPARLMIVASPPAPGLSPSPAPDPSGVPNNHLSYAIQWFLFAAVASIIYVVALSRRGRRRPDGA